MTLPDAKRKAFEIAAGLIEAMDAAKFWGDEIYDAAIEDRSGMEFKTLDMALAMLITTLRMRAK